MSQLPTYFGVIPKMLELALKQTERSTHLMHYHGVVVIRGGAILAVGSNRWGTHAEVNALKKLWPSERIGTKVWSVRRTPGGKLGMAKPCANCEAYLKAAGVKTVFYSTPTGIERMRL